MYIEENALYIFTEEPIQTGTEGSQCFIIKALDKLFGDNDGTVFRVDLVENIHEKTDIVDC